MKAEHRLLLTALGSLAKIETGVTARERLQFAGDAIDAVEKLQALYDFGDHDPPMIECWDQNSASPAAPPGRPIIILSTVLGLSAIAAAWASGFLARGALHGFFGFPC